MQPQRPDLVAKSITPDYALGGHTAALGLTWYGGDALPPPFRNGMFVGLHGSWNRSDLSGYRVIFVPFRDGRPAGDPIDVLTGFLKDGEFVAYGRPVGVTVTRERQSAGRRRRRQCDLACHGEQPRSAIIQSRYGADHRRRTG